jgi:D-alanine-D-alanine ligase
MSAQRKTVVAVIFGGRSVEHDVSIVTGHQIMQSFDPRRYEVIPVYITRDGRWITGDALKSLKNFTNEQAIPQLKGVSAVVLSPSTQYGGLLINPTGGLFSRPSVQRLDVVFPAIHGSHGEDGTLQGLLEMSDLPYVGCGVLASAICNDKAMTKQVLRQAGVPVVDDTVFTRAEWNEDPEAILDRLTAKLPFPMFVKPVTLGSSIAVARVDNRGLLRASIEVAASFDRRIMVEAAVTDAVEINCSVMGDDSAMRASVLEQPRGLEDFLTYEDKYLRGGAGGMKSAERIIPAPLSDAQTTAIQTLAVRAFRAVEGRGIARLDFLVQGEKVYLNEINTMPGSLALYLWRESGLSAAEVVDTLVKIGQAAHADKRRTTFDYKTSLVALTAGRGIKGLKGLKGSKSSKLR